MSIATSCHCQKDVIVECQWRNIRKQQTKAVSFLGKDTGQYPSQWCPGGPKK
jgi:hypothetical protein